MSPLRLLTRLILPVRHVKSSFSHTSRVSLAARFLSSDASSTDNNQAVHERIEKLVKEDKVVIFMKGTPDAPQCGFSNAVVKILEMHGLPAGSYRAHDVLADEDIRSGVKTYSDWPTIPQVYFEGEFIGGCDVLLDMHKNGSIVEELKKLGFNSPLKE